FMKDAEPGVAYLQPEKQLPPGVKRGSVAAANEAMLEILAKYNPGLDAQTFTEDNSAKFLPKGSDIIFEIHYTTTGKASSDRSKVGIILANRPPEKRFLTTGVLTNTNITIPPGDANAEVRTQIEVEDNV